MVQKSVLESFPCRIRRRARIVNRALAGERCTNYRRNHGRNTVHAAHQANCSAESRALGFYSSL